MCKLSSTPIRGIISRYELRNAPTRDYACHMENYGDKIQAAVISQINAEIAAAGMNKVELAKKAGIPNSTLSRYLKGERDIPLPVFAGIADALGITYVELSARAQRRLEGKNVL